MNAPRMLTVAIALTALPGCVIYLDHPPTRTISGQVVRADNDEPLTNARVAFMSGRKPFSLLPVDTFGVDAVGYTDGAGHFDKRARLNDSVRLLIQDQEYVQMFTLPPFTNSNTMTGLLLRISDRKPNQTAPPNAATPHR
jgi:hypothetical protein